jgi:hypothetical protein
MSKICDCCRAKLTAEFKDRKDALETLKAFFAFLEKYDMSFNLHKKPLTESENASIPSVPKV